MTRIDLARQTTAHTAAPEDDGLNCARGVVLAVLGSVVFWVIVGLAVL